MPGKKLPWKYCRKRNLHKNWLWLTLDDHEPVFLFWWTNASISPINVLSLTAVQLQHLRSEHVHGMCMQTNGLLHCYKVHVIRRVDRLRDAEYAVCYYKPWEKKRHQWSETKDSIQNKHKIWKTPSDTSKYATELQARWAREQSSSRML